MPSIDLGNVVGPKGDKGDPGPQGLQGIQGIQGPTGYGVIPGGAENSFLAKNSAVDYDTKWMTLPQIGSELVKPDNPVGAALSGKASNPNLLDNWYFVDPINQRENTEYIGKQGINIYTIDRWFVWNEFSACCTISVTQDGLKFTLPPGCRLTFNQVFPKGEFIVNKTYTFSYIKDGNIVYGSPFVNDIGSYILVGVMEEVNTTDKPIEFTVSAAKVELGPVQTLAHQDADGNWVLNDPPPNKALELVKCQRYQLEPFSVGHNQGYIGPFISSGGSKLLGMIFTPTTMRTQPIVENLNLSSIKFWDGKSQYNVTGISIYGFANIGVHVDVAVDAQLDAGTVGFIYKEYSNLNPFILSCNL